MQNLSKIPNCIQIKQSYSGEEGAQPLHNRGGIAYSHSRVARQPNDV